MAKKRKTIADYEREAAAEDKKRASQFVVPRPAPRFDTRLPTPRERLDLRVPMPEAAPTLRETGRSWWNSLKTAPQGVVPVAEALGPGLLDMAKGVGKFGYLAAKDKFTGRGEALDYLHGSEFGGELRDRPTETMLGLTPLVGDAMGIADITREAIKARRAGDEATAAEYEKMLLPMAGAGLIPEVGAQTFAVLKGHMRPRANLAARSAPPVNNRMYREQIGANNYVPGDVLPKYGYRNVSNPAELDALLRDGYMLPREGRSDKYFTMSDAEEPKLANRTAKPVLRVRSENIPFDRAVAARDVELWDDPTNAWKPVLGRKKGGLAVKGKK